MDQDSYDFGREAQATIAPAWRNEITMSSIEAIAEHAPGKSIELITPRPLLMILAKDDKITPPYPSERLSPEQASRSIY